MHIYLKLYKKKDYNDIKKLYNIEHNLIFKNGFLKIFFI